MKLSLSTEWLFFHLWKKNPDTNTSCPGVFLADTLIYRLLQSILVKMGITVFLVFYD